MKNIDSIKIKGVFEQRIYKNSILIEYFIDDNLVIDLGKNKIAKLLANDGIDNHINGIGFGEGVNTPTIADSSLTNPFTKNVSGYSYPTSTSVKFEWTLLTSEANGKSITEYGLYCADGTLFARKVRGAIAKEGDIFIDGSWTIRII